jgi:hypothetical protein
MMDCGRSAGGNLRRPSAAVLYREGTEAARISYGRRPTVPGHVPGVSSSPQMELTSTCADLASFHARARLPDVAEVPDTTRPCKRRSPVRSRYAPLESCSFTSGRVAARAAAQRVHVQCNNRRRAPPAGLFRGHAADADSGAADPGVAAVAFGAVLRPKTSRTGSQLAVGEPVA